MSEAAYIDIANDESKRLAGGTGAGKGFSPQRHMQSI